MIKRIKTVLFVICIVLVFTAQSKRPDDKQRPERSGSSGSHEHAAQPVSNLHNNQTHVPVQATHTPQTLRRERPSQGHIAQVSNQRRPEPRVYAVSAPVVENRQPLHHQHHKYWHPRYNFYGHQYYFYPYVNIASMVELSPDCIQVFFNGQTYYYDHWVFYVQTPQGFLAVPPPIGIIVPTVSSHAAQVIINGGIYYNHNDVYYEPVAQGFEVVEPLQ